MTTRTPSRCLAVLLATVLAGCGAAPPGPDQAPAGRGMPSDLQVVMLHVGLNDQVATRGLIGALPAYTGPESWLLWPVLPPVRGVEAMQAALRRQPGLDSARFVFDPLRIEVSPDTTLALVYGAVALENPATAAFRIGRYLMAVERREGEWQVAATAFVNLVDSRTVVPDTAATEWPAVETVGPAAEFIATDLAFADSAARSTAAEAFGHWVAPDGVTFASTGQLQRGPDQVAGALRRLDGTKWSWHPIAAGASVDGSLGWTIGEATILVPGEQGAMQALRSKYLSLWQRQPDGTIRFIADGGNDRQ